MNPSRLAANSIGAPARDDALGGNDVQALLSPHLPPDW
jgi:hypothetical protein